MVANAGIVRFHTVLNGRCIVPILPLTALSFTFVLDIARLEDYCDVMNVNIQGVLLCYRDTGLKGVEQGRPWGPDYRCATDELTLHAFRLTTFVGASSITGKAGERDGCAHCAGKFAIRGMTQAAGECTSDYYPVPSHSLPFCSS